MASNTGNSCYENYHVVETDGCLKIIHTSQQGVDENHWFGKVEYVKKGLVGTGTHGCVYAARAPRLSKNRFVVKVAKTPDGLMSEAVALQIIASQRLAIQSGLIPGVLATFQNRRAVVMPYARGGSLYDIVFNTKVHPILMEREYKKQVVKRYLLQCLSYLKNLEKNSVFYTDFKLDNVLIMDDSFKNGPENENCCILRLGDLGSLATFSLVKRRDLGVCGTCTFPPFDYTSPQDENYFYFCTKDVEEAAARIFLNVLYIGLGASLTAPGKIASRQDIGAALMHYLYFKQNQRRARHPKLRIKHRREVVKLCKAVEAEFGFMGGLHEFYCAEQPRQKLTLVYLSTLLSPGPQSIA